MKLSRSVVLAVTHGFPMSVELRGRKMVRGSMWSMSVERDVQVDCARPWQV